MPGIGLGNFDTDHAQPDVYGMDLKRWHVTQFQQVGSGALLMEPFWSQPNTGRAEPLRGPQPPP